MTPFLGSYSGLEPLSLLIMTIKFRKTTLEEKDLENHSSKQFIKILYKEGGESFPNRKNQKTNVLLSLEKYIQ